MVRLMLAAPLGLLLGALQACGAPAGSSPTIVRLPNGSKVDVTRHYVSLPNARATLPRQTVRGVTSPAVHAVAPSGCIDSGPAFPPDGSSCCSGKAAGGFCVRVVKGCASAADCSAGLACVADICCQVSGGCFAGSDCCSGTCSGDTCS